jgi:putative SOS response-associated peptidase YedK
MCGRYLFKQNEDEELHDWVSQLNLGSDQSLALHEVFPTNSTIVLTELKKPEIMTWGLPKWDGPGVIINARSETVMESRFFKEHMLNRRCLIKADGFFEWDKNKQKHLVQSANGLPFYMAGCFDTTADRPRFVILTDESEGAFRTLHTRVPLMIPEAYANKYLSDGASVLEDFHNLRQIDLTWVNQAPQLTLF